MNRFLAALFCLVGLAAADDYALLVGCTEYPRLRDNRYYATSIRLYGPGNDTALLRDTLVKYVGVPEANITVLTGWPENTQFRPTRSNILHHLARLAEEAGESDRVIVHLAGHGSQQPDRSEDELDGLDEIFLPADVKQWDGGKGEVENSIPDDELGKCIRAIRDAGATVWLLMDCCHSGTMVRAPADEVRARHLDPALLGVPATVVVGAVEPSPLRSDLRDIVAMYGAQSHRVAPELKLPRRAKDARWHGLFTFNVAAQLRRTGGHVTFRELHARVIAAYQALPYYGTVPVAEGDLALQVGGGRSTLPPLFVQAEGTDLVLNAGKLAGIGQGTVLAIFGPDAKERIGYAEVATAGLERSICREVAHGESGIAVLEEGPYSALVVSASIEDYRLKLAVLADSLPREVTDCFRNLQAKLEICSKASDADWILAAEQDESYVLRPARSGGRSHKFPIDKGKLAGTLNLLFRAENLKRLAASGQVAALPAGLSIQVLCGDSLVEPGSMLRPGDQFWIVIQNGTGRRYDVTVLLLDPHYNLITGFPRDRSATLRGEDKNELRIGPFTITDGSLGAENLIALAVPRRETDPEVSLAWLAGPGLTRAERGSRSRVEDLLHMIAFRGTERGAEIAPESVCASLLTWRTEWGSVQAPREFSAPVSHHLRMEHCAALITQCAQEAWQPAAAQVRPRGGGAAVYQQTADAVVVVRTRTGHGTGFLVDSSGHVLTNHHVVATGFTYSRGGRPIVQVHRGDRDEDGWMQVREEAVPACVVLVDEAKDLALLKVQASERWFSKMPPIRFARATRVSPAEDCYIVGHPASGMLWSLRQGRVAKVGWMPRDLVDIMVGMLAVDRERRAEARTQIQALPEVKVVLTTCGGNPGDSGSPLLDREGNLLGITYAIPRDVRTDKFAYHVHADEVREFLEREHETGPVIPDAWRIGPVVSLSKSPGAARYDVLMAGTRRPEQILIDVDGDTKDLRPENLAVLLSQRGFDAEAAFHLLDDRRIAFYDTQNNGVFDLILVDDDNDPEADVRFSLSEDKWTVRLDVATDWLKADYLKFEDGARRARTKLRLLVEP